MKRKTLTAVIDFNDFAEYYCGTNNREEQHDILMDNFVNMDSCGMSEEELNRLYDKKLITLTQQYEDYHGFFETTIDGVWTCDAIEPFFNAAILKGELYDE